MPKSPDFTENQCKAFAQAANPHQWLLSASNLHTQAVNLFGRRGGGQITLRTPGQPDVTWDETNRATFLLGAFALEDAIKAFLVYENPVWVDGGRLSRDLRSHRLVHLSERSSLIPYAKRDAWVLAGFEDGNESWMRYPCGRNANEIEPEQHLHAKLWEGYVRVMRGYGRKLHGLLWKGWTDPYGTKGRWEMTGNWLSEEPKPDWIARR